MKNLRFNILIVSFLFVTILISNYPLTSVADFDKTGLEEDKRYIWTIDKVDTDNIEDLNDNNEDNVHKLSGDSMYTYIK